MKIPLASTIGFLAAVWVASSLPAQTLPDSLAADSTKVEVRVNGRATSEITIGSGLKIDTVKVVVTAGDQVKSLLRSRGIVPDAAAIGLFYQLNPEVSNADELTVGSTVRLPSISSDPALVPETQGRISYAFLVDTSYKAVMREQSRLIAELTDSLTKLTRAGKETRSLDANAASIERATETVAKSSIPLSPQTAANISLGLDDYRGQIEDAIKMTSAERVDVSAAGAQVAHQVAATAKASSTGQNSRIAIEIGVIDKNGVPSQNVQIFYTRPIFGRDRDRAGSVVKLTAANVTRIVDVGTILMWVESLSGTDMPVNKPEHEIKSDTKEVVLVFR